MNIVYGSGDFEEDRIQLHGRVILDDYKIFLEHEGEPLPSTFTPLDRIESIQQIQNTLMITIRPVIVHRYSVKFHLEPIMLDELCQELIKRLDLKKRFLKKEWFRKV